MVSVRLDVWMSVSNAQPFYYIANATEEFLVRQRPLYEVVGQLGMWGFVICVIQAASLEHNGMHAATWNGATGTHCHFPLCLNDMDFYFVVGLILAYTAAMFILYTVAPILYRMASSGYYNLSLLSSDFYGLLFGLFLFVRLIFLSSLP
jgi:solute carrier family 35, member F1/2